MEIEGRIKEIGETKEFGANGFRKREMVITTSEQYPQHIMIEFTQDKCDILNSYHEGENVKVGINLRGREWVNPQGETKYFNSIQGWKIERTGGSFVPHNTGSAADQYHSARQQPPQPNTAFPSNEEEESDLPF